MNNVRPKKHLGQHFLTDLSIAERIVDALTIHQGYAQVLEVGPGMGVLTDFLLKREYEVKLNEIDRESIAYLLAKYPHLKENILEGDFLKMNLPNYFSKPFAVIGNFPYNISTQIFFKVLENKEMIPEVVGMLQKEVAERICSKHGSKVYGILSVLVQVFYTTEYLFTVEPHVFNPPPKVRSAIIRLKRNDRGDIGCGEKMFLRVVKAAFQTRRKTLRNALKSLNLPPNFTDGEQFNLRAEQLSVEEFITLACQIQKATM